MSEITGFLGISPADICLYTALSVQNTGKSVCVIDHSEDGILYRSIPAPEGQLEAVTYRGVDFVRKKPLPDWQDTEYGHIFVQLGTQPEELCMALCDRLVLVMNAERYNMDIYRNYMRQIRMPMIVLLRGFCPYGIPVNTIKDYFMRENNFVEKWILLPLSEYDEAYRIGMQYECFKKFAYISSEMEWALVRLLRSLENRSSVSLMRAVKQAKKGRMASMAPDVREGISIRKQLLPGMTRAGGYN